MSSRGGKPPLQTETSDTVIVLAVHLALVAACPSFKTTSGAPLVAKVRCSLLPASFMWNGLWSKLNITGSLPVVFTAKWRTRITFNQVVFNRSCNTASGTFHFLFGFLKLTWYSCRQPRSHE